MAFRAMCDIKDGREAWIPNTPPKFSPRRVHLFQEMWKESRRLLSLAFHYEQTLYPAVLHVLMESLLTYEKRGGNEKIPGVASLPRY
jgi:hypothetical protein